MFVLNYYVLLQSEKMKKKFTIVIDPKCPLIMDEKKHKTLDCANCLEDIQKSVNTVVAKIDEDFNKQRAKMSEEWVIFLATAEDKLNKSILHSEKETDQVNTNSKWILGIVLGITFFLGAAVGVIYTKVSEKADRTEVVTMKEFVFLHELTKSYNADHFLQNPNAKVDSTNYNLLVKAIFGGTLRGSSN